MYGSGVRDLCSWVLDPGLGGSSDYIEADVLQGLTNERIKRVLFG